ncbi:2-dehydro-3-deoxygalactonokinase [Brucella gallinifaecis]|uniref:2-dehydro-3-deoxygalactonokinase n=1 Tax=Brucella gallinifaecis TaxID=215590 RepID=A0A502BPJ4_9HYPH|nr:2-dehydro-3-deoxygalactonokinase [Brucella gallinifaecis]TPF76452.1 2-dehydro-3-deoxygalactonokinase [Brucella gallinifaecis]
MSGARTPFVAVADWGTTRFRLWTLDVDGNVINENRGDDGLLHAKEASFEVTLERHLAQVDAPDDLSVVICGMAGSRTGWIEAPYMSLPAGLEGIVAAAVRVPAKRPVIMLPGVARRSKDAPDVMRGEETKLLGLVHRGTVDAVVVMPGTHAKWVQLSDGQLNDYRSFMTGELFALLKDRSVLSGALEGAGPVEPESAAFAAGVKASLETPELIANALFTVRAGWLVHDYKPSDQLARLSGLLIGLEIAGGRTLFGKAREVLLLSDGMMGALYASALEIAGVKVNRIEADELVRDGLFMAARYAFAGGAQ